MKKPLLWGMLCCVAVFIVALVVLLAKPGVPTIESGTFDVRKWNTPEFIEANTMSIQEGVVMKEMESDTPELFDCIVEAKSNTGEGKTYLVYYVDTVKHNVGDEVKEWTGVWIASYNYEESIDVVRRIPVYLSPAGVKLLQSK